MQIRPAEADDVAAICAIYSHYVRTNLATFELVPPDEAEIRDRLGAVRDRGLPYLVADVDSMIAGYAYATPWRERPAYGLTVENSVYVDPAHGQRGIGKALMTAIIAACEAAGYRQMMAVISEVETGASIRLHEALGFRHAGILKSVGRKNGVWVDTVLMQRSLGPGDAEPPAREPGD